MSAPPPSLFRSPRLSQRSPHASSSAQVGLAASASTSSVSASAAVAAMPAAASASPPSSSSGQPAPLPPYADADFTAQAQAWADAMSVAARTPVQAADVNTGQSRKGSAKAAQAAAENPHGFSPRSAALLDRSYLLPARLAKRQARAYHSPHTALATYQTKEFRDIFAGAALGTSVQQGRLLAQAASAVPQRAKDSALLRPHMHDMDGASRQRPRSANKPDKKASELSVKESSVRPAVLHQSRSASALQPSDFFKRPPAVVAARGRDKEARGVQPTYASKQMRAHPSKLTEGSSALSHARRRGKSSSTAAATSSSSSDDDGDRSPSAFGKDGAVAPPAGLIFADMTGTRPRERVLNRAPREGDGAAPGQKPPRRLAPMSGLQAEEDRMDPQAERGGRHARLGHSSSAATDDANDDSVSDIEVNYADLLDTDDSEDGLEEFGAGPNGSGSSPLKLRRRREAEAGRMHRSQMKLAHPPALSATMLVLSGVKLPEWPHTVESEDDVDEDERNYLGTLAAGVREEGEDDAEAEQGDGDDGLSLGRAARAKRRKQSRPNPYALAAEREEASLHFLDPGTLRAMADIAKRGQSLSNGAASAPAGAASPVSSPVVEEKESFEDGKRVLLSPASAASAMDASLRQALGGGPLERLAVIAAENHLKRLAKEALRRGGEYMQLDEEAILARLEEERSEHAERIRRIAGARRDALPSVGAKKTPVSGSGVDALADRALTDLTPMKIKNMSEREEAAQRLAEQAAALNLEIALSEDAAAEAEAVDDPDSALDAASTTALALARRVQDSRPTSSNLHATPSKPKKPTITIVDSKGHLMPEFKKQSAPMAAPAEGQESGQATRREAGSSEADSRDPHPALPLSLRPPFSITSSPSSAFPPVRPLPSVSVAAHLRPPRALGSQIERWLRKHGQVVRQKISPEELAKYRAIFSLLDEDGSGSLSLKELQDALRNIGIPMRLAELTTLASDIKAESLRTQSAHRRSLIDFDEFVNGLARAGEWDTLCRLAEGRKEGKEEKRREMKRKQAKAREKAEEAAREAAARHVRNNSGVTAPVATATGPFVPKRRPRDPPPATTPLTHALASSPSSPKHGIQRSASIRSRTATPSHTQQAAEAGTSGEAQQQGRPRLRKLDFADSVAPDAALSPKSSKSEHVHGNEAGDGATGASTHRTATTATHRDNGSSDDDEYDTADGSVGSSRTQSRGTSTAGTSRTTRSSATRLTSSSSHDSKGSGAELLPFTLWVPAYNRWKQLDRMMGVTKLSDAQLDAMIEQDRVGEMRQAEDASAAVANASAMYGAVPLQGVAAAGHGSSAPSGPSRKAVPLLCSPATFITPEVVWDTHTWATVETEEVVGAKHAAKQATGAEQDQQVTTPHRKVKVARRVLVPVEGSPGTSSSSASRVDSGSLSAGPSSARLSLTAVTAHLPAVTVQSAPGIGPVVVASRTRKPLEQLTEEHERRRQEEEEHERQQRLAAQGALTSQEEAEAVDGNTTQASDPAASKPSSVPTTSRSGAPSSPVELLSLLSSRAPLESPPTVLRPSRAASASTPLARSIRDSQARLDARGNALDVAELAGQDLYHPNPLRPYRTAEEEKMMQRLAKEPLGASLLGSTHTGRIGDQGAGVDTATRTGSTAAGDDPSSFTLDLEASSSSQSLPFLWRQTQESVRVARLTSEADRAREELEQVLAGEEAQRKHAVRGISGGTAGVSDPDALKHSPEVLALERSRKHALASEKHQLLLRETESKRITREIFESFNAKQRARRDMDKMRRRKEEQQKSKAMSDAWAMAAGDTNTQSTNSGMAADPSSIGAGAAPSRATLLSTRFLPPSPAAFASSNTAASMFASAAAASEGVSAGGVSTHMLAAQQHLKKEQATHARMQAIADAKKAARREAAVKAAAAESAEQRARAKKEAKEAEVKARAESAYLCPSSAATPASASCPRTASASAAVSARARSPSSPVPSSASAVVSVASPDPLLSPVSLAAQQAALALAELESQSCFDVDPTLSMDDFIPLPSLDFLAGARLRASMAMEEQKRIAQQRSRLSMDHYGELIAEDAATQLSNEEALFAAPGVHVAADAPSVSLSLGVDPASLVRSHRAREVDIGRAMGQYEEEKRREEAEQLELDKQEEARAEMDRSEAGQGTLDASASTVRGGALGVPVPVPVSVPLPLPLGLGPGLPASGGVDYSGITSLWSSAAQNIERSRALLRDKQRAEDERARLAKQSQYEEQARRAYGECITQGSAGQEGSGAPGSRDRDPLLLSDDRAAHLDWLLFSSGMDGYGPPALPAAPAP